MDKKQKIIGFLLISLGILIFLSLIHFDPKESIPKQASEVQHNMGLVGFWVSFFLFNKTLGLSAYIFPILMIAWGINLTRANKFNNLGKISLFLLLFSLYFSIGTAVIAFPRDIAVEKIMDACSQRPWGMIGGVIYVVLKRFFGDIGAFIVYFTLIAITILNIVELNLSEIFLPISNKFKTLYASIFGKMSPQKIQRKRHFVTDRRFPEFEGSKVEESLIEDERKVSGEQLVDEEEEIIPDEIADDDEYLKQGKKGREARPTVYVLPSPALLDELPIKKDEVSWDEFMTSAKTLEQKLADFGIQGKVVEINPGPVITRYEIEPAPGVKVNRFTSLADDLALVMRAKRIRVVAPIPGKAAIGIEIPNQKSSIVYLKEIIDSPQFKSSKSILTLALGKTIAGDIFTTDMVSLPHLLVAGATGSGKSVCLHSIIASLLFKAHPAQVQLVMIDPKRLELTPYSTLKNHHLLYREDLPEEVVTSAANAVMVLKSLEREMEKRYELLARAGVRNIEDYNNSLTRSKWEQPDFSEGNGRLPYIVLIIDELADLMLTAAREVEEPIARLTQMSRAVGIHLIVATQRPSVDVITGVIKANFPARMAFQVATKTDSRTILDMNGAEKLLGKGDMLFIPPGSPEPIRIHGAYVSHEEVKRIIEHIKQQPPLIDKPKLLTEEEAGSGYENGKRSEERDELFEEALKLVVRHQQGSSSLLQRRLKIGYTRAARIIDQLEQAGFVGPFDGSKAREVLIDEEGLREIGIV